MSRVAVYSAIFGNYDAYKEPPEGNFDSFLFTDTPMISKRSAVQVFPSIFRDTTRTARMLKLLPHVFLPGYDVTLWLDGSFTMKSNDVDALVQRYLKESSFATFKHRMRDCIYDEAVALTEIKKDDPQLMAAQVDRYREEGFPKHAGLIESCALLRRSLEPDVVAVDCAWWRELRDWSRRDQLSFNYVARQLKFPYTEMEGTVLDNPHFQLHDHVQQK